MQANSVAQTPILGAGAPAKTVSAAGMASLRVEEARRPYHALLVLGMALAFVGWVDVALNLFPPAFGNPDWEIGTISITIDSLPLATLGMGLATVGAALRGRTTVLRVLGVLAWLAVIFVASAAALFLLSLPVVWAAVAEPMRAPFTLAASKTVLLGTVYLLFYVWLGVFAWRYASSIRKQT